MGVGSGGDQEVHHAGPWLASGVNDRCGELPVTGGHRAVHRERVKAAFEHGQPPQTFGPDGRLTRHEHAEVQLGQGRDADR